MELNPQVDDQLMSGEARSHSPMALEDGPASDASGFCTKSDAKSENKEAFESGIGSGITENSPETNSAPHELLESDHVQSQSSTVLEENPKKNDPAEGNQLKPSADLSGLGTTTDSSTDGAVTVKKEVCTQSLSNTSKPCEVVTVKEPCRLPEKTDTPPANEDHCYSAPLSTRKRLKPLLPKGLMHSSSEETPRILLPYPRLKKKKQEERILTSEAPLIKPNTTFVAVGQTIGTLQPITVSPKLLTIPGPNPPTFKPVEDTKLWDNLNEGKVNEQEKKNMAKMAWRIESLERIVEEKTAEIKLLKRKCGNASKAIQRYKRIHENDEKTIFKQKLELQMLQIKSRRLEAELEDVLKPLKPPQLQKSVKLCMPPSMVGSNDLMQGSVGPDGNMVTFEVDREEDGSSNKQKSAAAAPSADVVSSFARLPRKSVPLNVKTSSGVHRVRLERKIANNGVFTYTLRLNENVKLKPLAPNSCSESVQSTSVQIEGSEFHAVPTVTEEGTTAYHLMRSSPPLKNTESRNNEDMTAVQVILAIEEGFETPD